MQDVFVAFILFGYVGPIFLGCSLTDPTPYMRVFLSRACKKVSPPETMKQRLFTAAKAFLLHEHTSYAGCANFYNLPETSLERMLSEFRGTDAHMALLKMGSISFPYCSHWHCLKFRQHPKFTCRPGHCTCRPDQSICRLWVQLQGNASHFVYGSL